MTLIMFRQLANKSNNLAPNLSGSLAAKTRNCLGFSRFNSLREAHSQLKANGPRQTSNISAMAVSALSKTNNQNANAVVSDKNQFKFSPNQAIHLNNNDPAHMRNWLYFERFVNGIAPRANNPLATYTEVAEQFRPNSTQSSFQLPLFSLPKEKCNVFASSVADPRILSRYVGKDHASMAVYPQIRHDMTVPHMADIVSNSESQLNVVPTSSSRSLYVVDSDGKETGVPPHCVKTHLPLRITRAYRSLTDTKIKHSLKISELISTNGALQNHSHFAYLPETLGITVKGKDSWGFLVREMLPRPYLPGNTRPLLPLFGLYSKDVKNPDNAPVLCEMIKASGQDPKQFVLDKILFPIIKTWVDVFLKTGVIMESHGQNTCFELDENGMPGRVVCRDFDTYVSKDITEQNGVPLDGFNLFKVSKNTTDENFLQTCSILSTVFDQSMKTPFDRIAQICETNYNIPAAELQKCCKEYLKQVFPKGDTYFPENGKVFNFKEGAIRTGGKPELSVTNDVPVWR